MDSQSEVLVPMPTYPLYTAVLAKIDARARYYRTDPARGWLPDLDHLESLVTKATRALVVIDPNNPTGATYPVATRRALLDFADRHGLVILADEVYGDLGYDGPIDPIGKLDPDAAIISFSSLSKAYLAPGWRTGWMAVGRSPRLDDALAAIKKDVGRAAVQHGADAVRGGRSAARRSLAPADLPRRAPRRARPLTATRLSAMPGMTCDAPDRRLLRDAEGRRCPPGRTDEDYVLGLLRATGVLCVYGSGFGMPPEDGYFRVVFLASPDELDEIYDLMADFTARFRAAS